MRLFICKFIGIYKAIKLLSSSVYPTNKFYIFFSSRSSGRENKCVCLFVIYWNLQGYKTSPFRFIQQTNSIFYSLREARGKKKLLAGNNPFLLKISVWLPLGSKSLFTPNQKINLLEMRFEKG